MDRVRQIEPGLLAWAPSQCAGARGRVQRQGVGGAGGGKVQIAWEEGAGGSERNLGHRERMQRVLRQ